MSGCIARWRIGEGCQPTFARSDGEVEALWRELAAPHRVPVQVDERVLVVHAERRGGQGEALVDEVLGQVVLPREAHRAQLPVHASREAAIRVDAPTEAVARFEDRDAVARLLEQERGGQPGDARTDDHDVTGS